VLGHRGQYPLEKIIYDIGSNNGDDIPYYLKKSDKVIALEANPILCKQIENRFLSSIKDNRLIVINCVVTAKNMDQKVPFYIHKKKSCIESIPGAKTERPTGLYKNSFAINAN
jgi:hypothetical protein